MLECTFSTETQPRHAQSSRPRSPYIQYIHTYTHTHTHTQESTFSTETLLRHAQPSLHIVTHTHTYIHTQEARHRALFQPKHCRGMHNQVGTGGKYRDEFCAPSTLTYHIHASPAPRSAYQTCGRAQRCVSSSSCVLYVCMYVCKNTYHKYASSAPRSAYQTCRRAQCCVSSSSFICTCVVLCMYLCMYEHTFMPVWCYV
jgi:hypothetical protein